MVSQNNAGRLLAEVALAEPIEADMAVAVELDRNLGALEPFPHHLPISRPAAPRPEGLCLNRENRV